MSRKYKDNQKYNSLVSEKKDFTYLQIEFDRVELSALEKQSPEHARWAINHGYIKKPFRSSVTVEIIPGMEATHLMEIFQILYSTFGQGGGPWEDVLKKSDPDSKLI